MPQKKNPDAWELIRGKTGRIYGSLFALLTTCKGLPSSYQRDLQEDKEPLFAAHDQALAMVQIAAARAGRDAVPRGAAPRGRAGSRARRHGGRRLSRRVRGVPFREAHEIVGKVLRAAEQEGKSIREMPLERLKEFSPAFGARSGHRADARIRPGAPRCPRRHGTGSGRGRARRLQCAAREARGKSMRAHHL